MITKTWKKGASYLIALGASASSKNAICTACELGEDKRFKRWSGSQLVLIIYRD